MTRLRTIGILLIGAACLWPATPKHSALKELRAMAKADQDCRMAGGSCAKEDEIRQRRVLTLLAEGKVNEPEAKECAALILQHSGLTLCDGRYQAISLDNFQLAHLLAKAAAEQGRRSARWLAAASLDRYLVFSGMPQKYGTQTVFDPALQRLVVPPVDPRTTDAERAEWGVEPLATFLKRQPPTP